jgi:hypothetical protein
VRWSEYRDRLPIDEQRRLKFAVRIGAHDAQQSARIVIADGDLDDLRRYLDTAIDWLTAARQAL